MQLPASSAEFLVTTGSALVLAWVPTAVLMRSLLFSPRRAARSALAMYVFVCACWGTFGTITMPQTAYLDSNWLVQVVFDLVSFIFIALAWPPLALLGLVGG